MNREDVVRMAEEAEINCDLIDEGEGQIWYITIETLERFAALVAAAEREACAKVCEGMARPVGNDMMSAAQWTATSCAAAIRARGQEPPR